MKRLYKLIRYKIACWAFCLVWNYEARLELSRPVANTLLYNPAMFLQNRELHLARKRNAELADYATRLEYKIYGLEARIQALTDSKLDAI